MIDRIENKEYLTTFLNTMNKYDDENFSKIIKKLFIGPYITKENDPSLFNYAKEYRVQKALRYYFSYIGVNIIFDIENNLIYLKEDKENEEEPAKNSIYKTKEITTRASCVIAIALKEYIQNFTELKEKGLEVPKSLFYNELQFLKTENETYYQNQIDNAIEETIKYKFLIRINDEMILIPRYLYSYYESDELNKIQNEFENLKKQYNITTKENITENKEENNNVQ